MILYYRFRYWLEGGPGVTLRQLLSILILIFIFFSILLGGVSYLYRENKERIADIRSAVIQACRDSNEVRNEMRSVIQEVKNVAPIGLPPEQIELRYQRLTLAIAFLRDERCNPPRTGP